jgi:hypothetical protein
MSLAAGKRWILLKPPLSSTGDSAVTFVTFATKLVRIQNRSADDDRDRDLSGALDAALAAASAAVMNDRAILQAALRVLSDLVRQRWRVRVRRHCVEVCPSPELRADPLAEKDRVRRQELLKRDEQLAQPAVRRFVQDMERQRLYRDRFVSVFSLMRDGRELAAALRAARKASTPDCASALRLVIDPYLQFVTENARCDFTGLRLQDIWRYFRHTWVNQYSSIPGRTLAFLVRDRAARCHPVVGIGAIGSPIVQIKERDIWIGWYPTTFLEHASQQPSPQLGRWLRCIVTNAIAELFTDDFMEEGLVTPAELRHPTTDTLLRLQASGREQRRLHHRYARAQEHKRKSGPHRDGLPDAPWEVKAHTHLFRSKRALALADMLRARLAIDRQLSAEPTTEEVATLLTDREGRKATQTILRKAKADRVGISMADITVCGAVQPYNAVLGGKLVALLAASPEVIQEYRQRYGAAESEIASSMAGRPIVRPAALVFLGTTSLYGVGSSQYNRLSIPAERLGGRRGEEIRFTELGRSQSFGTSQYSSRTIAALIDLVHHANGGQRVNSIFGEGVSPKLRKVRRGLEVLQFPPEHLLRHGRRRIVYGVTAVRNAREMLLGMDESPDYLFSRWGSDATNAIADWWRERWLSHRIEQERVLEQVESHTLVRPIRHGARVDLPREALDQMTFSDDSR